MKSNLHSSYWLARLLGLTMLLLANQAAQAQAVRGLANVAGKWGSGTPMIAAGGDAHGWQVAPFAAGEKMTWGNWGMAA